MALGRATAAEDRVRLADELTELAEERMRVTEELAQAAEQRARVAEVSQLLRGGNSQSAVVYDHHRVESRRRNGGGAHIPNVCVCVCIKRKRVSITKGIRPKVRFRRAFEKACAEFRTVQIQYVRKNEMAERTQRP